MFSAFLTISESNTEQQIVKRSRKKYIIISISVLPYGTLKGARGTTYNRTRKGVNEKSQHVVSPNERHCMPVLAAKL